MNRLWWYFHALLPLLALLPNVVVQIGVYRVQRRWLRSFFAGFAAGAAVLFVLELLLWPRLDCGPMEHVVYVVGNGAAYALLDFFYFNFVNGGKTALRVRILLELLAAPDGLTWEELHNRYHPATAFTTKLNRLTTHGQIVRRDGRLFIGRPTMAWIAHIMVFMKRIVLGRSSEFDR